MNKEQHKQKHIKLHRSLDELLADFIIHTGKRPSETSLMELLDWAFEQTKEPTANEYKAG